MDEALKRRLVGAAVIMSLIVIFVPMLVEEEPVVREELSESNIPPEQDPIATREYHTEPLAVAEPSAQQASGDAGVADVGPAAPVSDVPAVNQDVVPVSADDETPAPAPPPPAPDDTAGQSEAGGRSTAESGEQREDLKAWVVQVASFTNPKFAQNLVDDLRDKGFAAFRDQVQSGGLNWYRVVVGPEVDKQRTREIQDEVVEATGNEKLRGAIKSYP